MHRHPHQKLIAYLAIGILLLAAACKPDPCADVACVHGACVDGTCDCAEGYEGEDCSAAYRDKFLRNIWHNSRYCGGSVDYLESRVTAGTTANAIVIHEVYEDDDSVVATVRQDSLFVPEQVFGVDYISGQGLYGEDAFTISFVVRTTGNVRTSCVAVFQK